MPEIELNCQSLPCPQPVLKCKECLDAQSPSQLSVIVDNDAAKENVSRFLASRGYSVNAEASNNIWKLKATLEDTVPCEVCEVMTDHVVRSFSDRTVLLLTTDVIGSGDDVLGGKLMKNFLLTLPELGETLWRIIMLNGAVKLAAEGSHVVDELSGLENSGVEILVCGTCLEHFGLLASKKVGGTTNMLDVVTSLQLATKVIRP
ncbi:sulfurtransferase-like selenium metabolism protein YedF [Oleidesulfovibrio sp.]|uniref:sulfurtransferase-like selenium metabolism protein YedF n=1 Tax=Oleidesulfovibrio sp. TaxID=2909707 RepID=UPI003A8C6FC6